MSPRQPKGTQKGTNRPSAPTPGSQRSRRTRMVAMATLVIIIGLVGATLAIPESNTTDTTDSTGPDSDSSSTSTSEPLTTTTKLDPSRLPAEGKELYALVQTGRAGAYYVKMQLSGDSLPIGAKDARLEIWRSGPRIRQDTTLTEDAGVTHGANFGGPEGTVTCRQQPGLDMACQQDSTSALPADADFLSSIMERLSGAQIGVRDDTIAGLAARCFVIDGANEKNRSELCLTAAGTPLVVEVPGLRAVALEAGTEVPESTFTPPVPVSGPSDSTTLSTTIDTVITPDDP